MIAITNRTVRALGIVEQLLLTTGRLNVRTISEMTGMSYNTVQDLTPDLVRGRVIKATKGYCGGLDLVSRDVTLWEVAHAVESPISDSCSSTWAEISAFFERTMKRTIVQQLMKKDPE